MRTQKKQQGSINAIAAGRWTAYMAAAAASTFAGAGSAEAEIHYSGVVNIKLTGNAQASLPLSNGASLVFRNASTSTSTYAQDFYLLMKGGISGSARGDYSVFGRILPANLPQGRNVSAGKFLPVTGNPDEGVLILSWTYGQFSPPLSGRLRGFVGFRFNTGKGTQYGWARIQTKNDMDSHIHDLIKDYAWGDPGDVILTGQKDSSESANAKSIAGSLGLLAFGAQGLNAWRTHPCRTRTD